MCGITGFYDESSTLSGQTILDNMLGTIRQRGPDSEGMWSEGGVNFGHRRLAVLDLSPAGHQPMVSSTGRFIIVFNGEIYNYKEIKDTLERQLNYQWRGHSDTEIMLAAIEAWGMNTALQAFNGMFAFAVWDRQQRKLILARDRLGEKPLYYTQQNGAFIFGSELRCLEAHPKFQRDIDSNALAEFFKFNDVPAPLTIYQNTFKLLPAHYLTWSPDNQELNEQCYWNLAEVALQGQQDLLSYNSDEEAINQLDVLLRDAVRLRMEADVPLGAFLSGGIDSSIVVAMMQAQSVSPVKTFSIGFDIEGYNEAEHAKAVAKHLGTDHTEQYVTGRQAMGVVPKLGGIYDEPFADASQIPTYLVSGIAKQHVTVCLSGDGGDELFGGYSRYQETPNVWHKLNKIPVRSMVTAWLSALSERSLKVILGMLRPILQPYVSKPITLTTFRHTLPLLSTKNQLAFYRMTMQNWRQPSQLVKNYTPSAVRIFNDSFDLPDFLHVMMLHDGLNYLPNDILTKVDRATMAVSLEGRIPLIDHRIAEFAWQLPASLKFKNNQGKWILRQVLYRYVPPELIDRPKMGFGVPLGSWLRHDLRDWVESLLDPMHIRNQGYLNSDIIQKTWQAHLSGHADYSKKLWSVLMFQAWQNER